MTASHIQVLPARERTEAPWKNGGGMTSEIAIAPPGAGLDDFDWRVSLAQVSVDSLFSTYAGVDRGLLVLRGSMALQIGGQRPRVLRAGMTPVYFPGEATVRATVLDGPVTDLNVMTRRGRCDARIVPAATGGADTHRDPADWMLLLLDAPFADVVVGQVSRRLMRDDAMLVSGAAQGAPAAAPGEFHRIDVWRCAAASAASAALRGDSRPC